MLPNDYDYSQEGICEHCGNLLDEFGDCSVCDYDDELEDE